MSAAPPEGSSPTVTPPGPAPAPDPEITNRIYSQYFAGYVYRDQLIPQEFAFMTQTFAFLLLVMAGIKAVLKHDESRAYNLVLMVGVAGGFALFAFLLDLLANSSCKGALRWAMRQMDTHTTHQTEQVGAPDPRTWLGQLWRWGHRRVTSSRLARWGLVIRERLSRLQLNWPTAWALIALVVWPAVIMFLIVRSAFRGVIALASNIIREAPGVEFPIAPPSLPAGAPVGSWPTYWDILACRRRFLLERLLRGSGGVDPSATRWFLVAAHVYLIVWVAMTAILLSVGSLPESISFPSFLTASG